MERQGIEVIVGMTKDPQFGPVLMFGLGGVMVEILKDVAFRVVPINERDARQMIDEIKGKPLLDGYRGSEPADVAKLRELLLQGLGVHRAAPGGRGARPEPRLRLQGRRDRRRRARSCSAA